MTLCGQALAIVRRGPTDHYTSIPDRNIFGLKPPPSPQTTERQSPQLPKITLTGITTILGNKRALMLVQSPGSKAGQKELSLILTEGQQQDDIEVLQIDEKAGTVRVNNSGTVMTLNFEKDGPKLPTTQLPSNNPAPPLPIGSGIPAPTNGPSAPGTYISPGLHLPIPRRILRSPETVGTPGVLSPTGGGPLPGSLSATSAPSPVLSAPETSASSSTPAEEPSVLPPPQTPPPSPVQPVPAEKIPPVSPAPLMPAVQPHPPSPALRP